MGIVNATQGGNGMRYMNRCVCVLFMCEYAYEYVDQHKSHVQLNDAQKAHKEDQQE